MMSTVSEKLLQVAQNNPKVYHSGQLNIVKNAECLKNNKSGSAMLLDDVSPVTHEMGVRVKSKNLLNYELFEPSYTKNGVTFTNNGDGTVTANGTATANTFYYFDCSNKLLGKYTLSGCPSGGSTTTYLMGLGASNFPDVGSGVTRNFPNQQVPNIFIKINGGTTVENLVFKPQLEEGSTVTAYTPYIPDLTAVKVSRCGKNLTNSLTDINAEQNSYVISRDNGIVTLGSKNVITYSSMAHLYDRILSAGTYTFSFDCIIENIKKCTKPNYVHLYVDNKFVANVIYDINKDGTYHRSFNFKITKKSRVLIRFYFNIDSITEASDTIITKAMFSNVQLELGSTATDYEPYITPTDYTPTADGTVNGVTSLYPNTTLTTDTNGVLIDCEYYKDVDKAFDELTTSVALSGGDT